MTTNSCFLFVHSRQRVWDKNVFVCRSALFEELGTWFDVDRSHNVVLIVCFFVLGCSPQLTVLFIIIWMWNTSVNKLPYQLVYWDTTSQKKQTMNFNEQIIHKLPSTLKYTLSLNVKGNSPALKTTIILCKIFAARGDWHYNSRKCYKDEASNQRKSKLCLLPTPVGRW